MKEEISFSFFQVMKILNYMDIQEYNCLFKNYKNYKLTKEKNNKNHTISASTSISTSSKYKENTYIFSYFFLTNILLFHYPSFFMWCLSNNKQKLVNFDKTYKNVRNMLIFILDKFKNKSFQENILYFQKKYKEILKYNDNIILDTSTSYGQDFQDKLYTHIHTRNTKYKNKYNIFYIFNNLLMSIHSLF